MSKSNAPKLAPTRARIVALMGSNPSIGAPDIYRVTLPFSHLDKNSGIKAGWLPADKAQEMMQAKGATLSRNVRDLFGYDIVVLRRWLGEKEDAGVLVYKDIKQISKELTGKEAIVVYESDDDYSSRYRPADITMGTWKPYIQHVDAVIASTEPLGQLMAEEAGLDKYYVAKNYIPYEMFTSTSRLAKREDDRITVMLAGTATHDEDWKVVADVMPKIIEVYPNVAFKVAGNVPDYLYGKCEFVAPVHYSQYPALLRQADILCCSLDPNDQFNRSKSYIKAIEGWSSARPIGKNKTGGCAVIVSKAESYRGVVSNRHNGLVVEHTPEAWENAIRLLIEDWHLRQKVQINGLKTAKGYDMAVRWTDWHEVFSNILASRGQKEAP